MQYFIGKKLGRWCNLVSISVLDTEDPSSNLGFPIQGDAGNLVAHRPHKPEVEVQILLSLCSDSSMGEHRAEAPIVGVRISLGAYQQNEELSLNSDNLKPW